MSKTNKLYPLSKLFPSVVTLVGLCVGLFSIKHAMDQRWELAVTFILIAGVIDGMDGRVARMLNASSNFGAQLDSLADFLNFGVAPAFILYLWINHEVKGLGWAITLFFIICQAIRLARFNANLDDDKSNPLSDKFFYGLPAPLGGSLSVAPIMVTLFMQEKFGHQLFDINAPMMIGYMSLIGLLMVSRVPTFSLKKLKIKREFVPLTFAILGLTIAAIIIEPWFTFPLMGFLYLISMPITVIAYYRMK